MLNGKFAAKDAFTLLLNVKVTEVAVKVSLVGRS